MDTEGIAQKMSRGRKLDRKGYAALFALVQWREDRVRQLNLPRRWVADDHVLLDLANVRPKDLAHLSAFRGLNKGELKNSGEAILKALRVGEESEGLAAPTTVKTAIPTLEESQALELLRCYVGILADRHKIAAKHLLTATCLLSLLRSKAEVPEDLSRLEILSAEAAKLIGEELIAMIRGKRALLIRNRGIEITKS